MDGGWRITSELDGVADQVLEELRHLRRLCHDRGEWIARDLRTALGDRRLEPGEGAAKDGPAVGRRGGLGAGSDARVGEEIVDERLHAHGPFDRVAHEILCTPVQAVPVPLCQEVHAAPDRAQGLLEVVGGNIGELLEIGVRARELCGTLRDPMLQQRVAVLQDRLGLLALGDVDATPEVTGELPIAAS